MEIRDGAGAGFIEVKRVEDRRAMAAILAENGYRVQFASYSVKGRKAKIYGVSYARTAEDAKDAADY